MKVLEINGGIPRGGRRKDEISDRGWNSELVEGGGFYYSVARYSNELSVASN